MSDLAEAVRLLELAGVPSPRYDATVLLAHAAGDEDRFAEYVERRAGREPLQHIVGSTGFRYLDVEVGPGVFVPRPETELVAGAAIEAARRRPAPIVVDLCAGSGAIALAVAHEVPEAIVHAIEVDGDAFEWLRRNAFGASITLHLTPALDALRELDGTVDVVVSNPPYVKDGELGAADPEVREHDPRRALVAGPDGLAVIRDVESAAARLLRPDGCFVVEHGDDQAGAVTALLAADRWVDVTSHRDLTGRPRYVTATRTSP